MRLVHHHGLVINDHGPMVMPGVILNVCPDTEGDYQTTLAGLREEWNRWAEKTGCSLEAVGFEQLLHYKWGYVDGHLTRWTCADVDEVLLEVFPAKVVSDAEGIDSVIPEMLAFVDFLADTDLIDPASDDRQVLAAHAASMEPRFRTRMADRSLYSPGKRLWTTALEEGVDLGDQSAVSAFVERFNAQLRRGRDDLLRVGTGSDHGHGGWSTGRFNPAPTGRITPRGTPPRPKPPGGRHRRRGRR